MRSELTLTQTVSGSLTEGAAAYSKVYFGGRCEEHWSNDYTLLVSYHSRRLVQAVCTGGAWRPCGGDEGLCALLRDPACPPFTARYFQAAAAIYAAAQDCMARGLSLLCLHECLDGSIDALAAAELARLLMDDCGFKLERALPVTMRCAGGALLREDEIAALEQLQPRTAQVARVLREEAAVTPVGWHDSRLGAFRSPFGALRCGEEAELGFTLVSGQASRAELILRGDRGFRRSVPMTRAGQDFRCRFHAPETPAALWYLFRLDTPQGARWLVPDGSGCYAETRERESEGFRLTVYRRDFDTPAWFRRAVMYQVFPDRFAFSNDGTAERGLAYHEALGQTPELHKSLDEPVRWQPRDFERDYSPDDFYGGTLRGIEQKLPYLQRLGIGCLYLNPIVEARSNHRYDASDYRRPDPILGTNEDFDRLCRRAADYGVRIMLDGVFSHTGADSLYFNRHGSYPSVGACQGRESPYYPWYEFKHFPEDYRCWWGFKDLPEVDELNPQWQDFVVTGRNSIVKSWLRRGAAGWRLDVADELPDEVLALIRRAAKEEKPDAPILGEVWEDPVLKESYCSRRQYALGDALDSVMNYPLRTGLLNFMLGRSDAYALRDLLVSQQMNYPQPMYYSLMNLIGSHDVERIRTALSAPGVQELRSLPRPQQLAYPFRAEDLDRAIDREKLCAAIQFALPGVPSIYYGDEQGMWGVGDPFNRQPFREGNAALFDYYVNLSGLRNTHAALSTGEAQIAACSCNVLTVLRWIRGDRDRFGQAAEPSAWLLVVNRAERELPFSADARAAGHGFIRGRVAPCEAKWIRLG